MTTSYTPQQAYDAIKNLEAQGQLPLPLPTATISVGIFDAATGTFKYSIQTEDVSYTLPSQIIDGKPTGPTVVTVTVGAIQVNVADLRLSFEVVNPQHSFTVTLDSFTDTITTDPISETSRAAAVPANASVGSGIVAATPARVGIGSVGLRHILTLDLGAWMPPFQTSGGTQVPGTQVSMSSGNSSAQIQLLISRPPLLASGAFTLPALPTTLLYAPPPGPLTKNYAEYAATMSFSSKITTGVTSSNAMKTANAYSHSDYFAKASQLVGDLNSIHANPYVAGVVAAIDLVAGFVSNTDSNTTDTTTDSTENDITVLDSETATLGTPVGLGPGVGDRISFLRNVLVAWFIANGELNFTVLGSDGVRSWTVQTLLADLQAMQAAADVAVGPSTNLDAATLQMLLGLDPFVTNPNPSLSGPRYVQNDPASIGGSGSDPNGDQINATHEITAADIETQTEVTATVTDYKPGWLVALFGGTPATENTLTMTYSASDQITTDSKQSATVFFFLPTDEPFVVGLYYDRLFSTFAFTQATE
jgi:hypothetical protein